MRQMTDPLDQASAFAPILAPSPLSDGAREDLHASEDKAVPGWSRRKTTTRCKSTTTQKIMHTVNNLAQAARRREFGLLM